MDYNYYPTSDYNLRKAELTLCITLAKGKQICVWDFVQGCTGQLAILPNKGLMYE